MKKSIMRKRIQMIVTDKKMQKESRDENALLLFVMKGKIRLTVEHVTQVLEEERIALINSNQTISYETGEDILLAKIPVLYEYISTEACGFRVRFERSPEFPELTRIVKDMLVNSDYNAENHTIYEYDAGYFRMLEFLIRNCTIHEAADSYEKEDSRKFRIMEYIHMNYDRQISLTDLASHLYLSVGYLSRYFAKTFGMGFSQYLNRVRLEHVYDELLYSEKPITQISYDNGFTSISQFNRSFKLMYGQTPSEMRSNLPALSNVEENKEEKTIDEMQKEVVQYLSKWTGKAAGDKNRVTISAAGNMEPFDSWYSLLNVGSAFSLLSSALQNQIKILHEEAGFCYIRFWGLFSDHVFLREVDGQKINFSKIERIFDFILSVGMKPFIYLEEKPERINSDINRKVRYVENDVPFENRQAWERTFSRLMSHMIERYGSEEMASWKIEVGQYRYYHSPLDNEAFYFEVFDNVYKTVRSMVPGLEVGGTIATENFDLGDKTEIFLNHWYCRQIKPDFLSMIVYAYEVDAQNWIRYTERCRSRKGIQRLIERIREKMVWAGFDSKSLIISEWSNTVSDRNLLNDTAFKGAYILNTILDLYDNVRMMGYFMASDQNTEHYDSSDLIFGGNGLVTKDGIAKPAAYAFMFMNQLYSRILACNERYIITTNGKNKYRIVCHNLVMPNYKYYMTTEDNLDINKIMEYFDDEESVREEFLLTDITPGKYRIRIQRVSTMFGNVFQAWKEFGFIRNLSLKDVEYLKKNIGPKMEVWEQSTESSCLDLDIVLTSNELALLFVEYMGLS